VSMPTAAAIKLFSIWLASNDFGLTPALLSKPLLFCADAALLLLLFVSTHMVVSGLQQAGFC